MNTFRALSILALVVGVAAATPAEHTPFHFALARSAPAADATVTSPNEIRLWFTQVPRDGSLSVRLVDAGGELVETCAPNAQADDTKAFRVEIGRQLPAGSYTVAWRGVGDDGHPVQSEFGFTVASAATSFSGEAGR